MLHSEETTNKRRGISKCDTAMNTETDTRHGDKSRTPQRIARARAKELRQLAQNLREFVLEGKVETYRPEQRAQSGKILCREGMKITGVTGHEGQRIIEEAQRMELLAELTLEGLGLPKEIQCRKSK